MIDDIIQGTKHRMSQAVSHTQLELNKVRTGRANPEMFDSITVDYYGNKTPINQVATISVPEPRLITIQPYEKPLIPLIEKSIMDSNMGFTPGNNGNSVLIPIPPLSEERRKELNRFVHQLVEDGRVSIRNVRRDANEDLKKLLKSKEIGEDQEKIFEKKVQAITDDHIKSVDDKVSLKEKEIMTI